MKAAIHTPQIQMRNSTMQKIGIGFIRIKKNRRQERDMVTM